MSTEEIIKNVIRVVLVLWFIILNMFILIPSFSTLSNIEDVDQAKMKEPTPPNPVVITPLDANLDLEKQKKQVESSTQQVLAYTQQVNAYAQQVNAYKAHAELSVKSPKNNAYQLVVKDTLSALLTTFLAALLSYVFINAVANAVNNRALLKHGKDAQPLKLF